MEAVALAVSLHSLALGAGMNVTQAFVPAATSAAAFAALALLPHKEGGFRAGSDPITGRRLIAWKLTVASLIFIVVLGIAVGPREWLYESVGAFYLFILVISTFSATHSPGEATSACMIGLVLAAAASIDSDLVLGFRWLTAASAIGTSISCMYRDALGHATSKPGKAFGGKFDIELVVSRTLLLPLMLTVAYSQSTDRHSLDAGEVVAALIVILAATGAEWGSEDNK